MDGLCYVATLAVSLGLVIYGFMMILQKAHPNENDTQVIQRQIRGFAYLLLSQIALILGVMLCAGFGVNSVRRLIESSRP
jgi:hypothetical protein